ncbi:hypothetical protein [Halochromatium glycolicum]|uniref:Uncharacterized protein n=1 Tax=Halochromatium glycolicum TaxID=85075 RepID=A0AAJ0U2Z0_9GAMM|nr:hypothetical protein [Halochromatium glycolicum]MBK1704267.1 hypothetical protein [Halochromatium glycolicum]
MSSHFDPDRIGMREFVRQLRPHIKIGDNGDFVIDENGVRAVGMPDSREINRLGLSDNEIDALWDFEDACRLDFPVTIEEVHDWASRVLGVNHPELMDAALILNQDEPKASVLWFKMPETILDLCRTRKANGPSDATQMPTQEEGTSETAVASALEIPIVEPGKPGRRVTKAEAAAFAIQIYQGQPKENKNMAEACRQAVKEHFPGHHDPKRKADSIAGTIRNQRNKAKP